MTRRLHAWQTVGFAVLVAVALAAAYIWFTQKLLLSLLVSTLAAGVCLISTAIHFQPMREPLNYRSLSIDRNRIEYVDLSNKVFVIPLKEIVQIEFVREEAMFEDIYGPYLETKWIVHTAKGLRIELMDEQSNRDRLMSVFQIHLADFDTAVASAAINSDEEGNWLCFQTSSSAENA